MFASEIATQDSRDGTACRLTCYALSLCTHCLRMLAKEERNMQRDKQTWRGGKRHKLLARRCADRAVDLHRASPWYGKRQKVEVAGEN